MRGDLEGCLSAVQVSLPEPILAHIRRVYTPTKCKVEDTFESVMNILPFFLVINVSHLV